MTPATFADEEMKKFLRTCTYGVVAGALVGAASLAFAEDPGSNLNPIARGASFGLYGGIALGLINMKNSSQDTSKLLIIPQKDQLTAIYSIYQF